MSVVGTVPEARHMDHLAEGEDSEGETPQTQSQPQDAVHMAQTTAIAPDESTGRVSPEHTSHTPIAHTIKHRQGDRGCSDRDRRTRTPQGLHVHASAYEQAATEESGSVCDVDIQLCHDGCKHGYRGLVVSNSLHTWKVNYLIGVIF